MCRHIGSCHHHNWTGGRSSRKLQVQLQHSIRGRRAEQRDGRGATGLGGVLQRLPNSVPPRFGGLHLEHHRGGEDIGAPVAKPRLGDATDLLSQPVPQQVLVQPAHVGQPGESAPDRPSVGNLNGGRPVAVDNVTPHIGPTLLAGAVVSMSTHCR